MVMATIVMVTVTAVIMAMVKKATLKRMEDKLDTSMVPRALQVTHTPLVSVILVIEQMDKETTAKKVVKGGVRM